MKSLFAGIFGSMIAVSTAFAQPSVELPKEKFVQPTADFLNVARNMNKSSIINICAGQGVPAGYIIVGNVNNWSCGNFYYNAYQIKQPESGDKMCVNSGYPDGFVITARNTSWPCGTGSDNAFIIKIPGETETICNFSPFPYGRVITSRATTFFCGGGNANAIVIKVPGQNETVCDFSLVPNGYVITGTASSWKCSLPFQNSREYFIRRVY